MEGFLQEVGYLGALGPMKWGLVERSKLKFSDHAPEGIALGMMKSSEEQEDSSKFTACIALGMMKSSEEQEDSSKLTAIARKAMLRIRDYDEPIDLLEVEAIQVRPERRVRGKGDGSNSSLLFTLTFSPDSGLSPITFRATTVKDRDAWIAVISSINSSTVPTTHLACLEALLAFVRAKGTEKEHIFRREVTQAEKYILHLILFVDSFSEKSDLGQPLTLPKNTDCYCASNLFKQMLRRLPESLLTDLLVPEFLKVAEENDLAKLKSLIKCLPVPNRDLLGRIIEVCYEVERESKSSKMKAKDLAIVIGPNFLVDLDDNHMLKRCLKLMPPLFEMMTTHRRDLFDLGNPRKTRLPPPGPPPRPRERPKRSNRLTIVRYDGPGRSKEAPTPSYHLGRIRGHPSSSALHAGHRPIVRRHSLGCIRELRATDRLHIRTRHEQDLFPAPGRDGAQWVEAVNLHADMTPPPAASRLMRSMTTAVGKPSTPALASSDKAADPFAGWEFTGEHLKQPKHEQHLSPLSLEKSPSQTNTVPQPRRSGRPPPPRTPRGHGQSSPRNPSPRPQAKRRILHERNKTAPPEALSAVISFDAQEQNGMSSDQPPPLPKSIPGRRTQSKTFGFEDRDDDLDISTSLSASFRQQVTSLQVDGEEGEENEMGGGSSDHSMSMAAGSSDHSVAMMASAASPPQPPPPARTHAPPFPPDPHHQYQPPPQPDYHPPPQPDRPDATTLPLSARPGPDVRADANNTNISNISSPPVFGSPPYPRPPPRTHPPPPVYIPPLPQFPPPSSPPQSPTNADAAAATTTTPGKSGDFATRAATAPGSSGGTINHSAPPPLPTKPPQRSHTIPTMPSTPPPSSLPPVPPPTTPGTPATPNKEQNGANDGLWKSAVDPTTGTTYWYNRATNQRTWTHPSQWRKSIDPKTKLVYWYNRETDERRWTRPPELDADISIPDVPAANPPLPPSGASSPLPEKFNRASSLPPPRKKRGTYEGWEYSSNTARPPPPKPDPKKRKNYSTAPASAFPASVQRTTPAVPPARAVRQTSPPPRSRSTSQNTSTSQNNSNTNTSSLPQSTSPPPSSLSPCSSSPPASKTFPRSLQTFSPHPPPHPPPQTSNPLTLPSLPSSLPPPISLPVSSPNTRPPSLPSSSPPRSPPLATRQLISSSTPASKELVLSTPKTLPSAASSLPGSPQPPPQPPQPPVPNTPPRLPASQAPLPAQPPSLPVQSPPDVRRSSTVYNSSQRTDRVAITPSTSLKSSRRSSATSSRCSSAPDISAPHLQAKIGAWDVHDQLDTAPIGLSSPDGGEPDRPRSPGVVPGIQASVGSLVALFDPQRSVSKGRSRNSPPKALTGFASEDGDEGE
eukprot:g49279.t1